MDDREIKNRLRELKDRTSSLVLIGPGEEGYLHQRKALDRVAEKSC